MWYSAAEVVGKHQEVHQRGAGSGSFGFASLSACKTRGYKEVAGVVPFFWNPGSVGYTSLIACRMPEDNEMAG